VEHPAQREIRRSEPVVQERARFADRARRCRTVVFRVVRIDEHDYLAGRPRKLHRPKTPAQDVAFGDALEPGAEVIDYPSMLDLPTPRLRAYARETVIAEKFQAMVALGRANSRMKDFYDLWLLSQSFSFDDDRLARAIAATFARRETSIPAELPDALTPAFADDDRKQPQWRAFLENVSLHPGSLADVTATVAEFIMPHAVSAERLKSEGELDGQPDR